MGLATAASDATPCCPGSNVLNIQDAQCDKFPDVGLHLNCNESTMFILDPNVQPNDKFTVDPVTGNLRSGHDIIQQDK